MYHFIYLKLPNKLPAYLANAGGCGLKCINMIYMKTSWYSNSKSSMQIVLDLKHIQVKKIFFLNSSFFLNVKKLKT